MAPPRLSPWGLALSLLALGGCGDDDAPLDSSSDSAVAVPEGCNPLAMGGDCLLPFPSDVFRQTGPGGSRVLVPEAVLPMSRQRDVAQPVDFLTHHPADGFSPIPSIVCLFPEGVAAGALVGLGDDLTRSVVPTSPTLLVDAESGELVPHFAELDPLAATPSDQALTVRPLVRLRNGGRYIVAVHDLPARDGGLVQAPPGFERIREGTSEDAELASRYEAEIFPVLDRHVERARLQAAWDFTVRSETDAMRDMIDARAAEMALMEESPPRITITEVVDDDTPQIWRRIEGTLTAALVVTDDLPGATLFRGADGRVASHGTIEVPFRMIIPRSVGEAAPATPARVVQFGHGFFGSRDEVNDGFVPEFAERLGVVVVGVDWWGMSQPDLGGVLDNAVREVGRLFEFTDRVHQAMVNQIALARALKTTLATHPQTQGAAGPMIDSEQVFFYGISQGHILGGTYLALAPDIERGALSVGGGAFSVLLTRAQAFSALRFVLEPRLGTALALQELAALSQSTLDRIDPVTYAPWVLSPDESIFAQSPPSRRVLMQVGLGDASVPNIGSWYHARALGIRSLEPTAESVFGLESVAGPVDSALVVFDYGIPEPRPGTFADLDWPPNEVHEAVRRSIPGQTQIDAFLRLEGEVVASCEGPCDPD